jgi:hypothetical protein
VIPISTTLESESSQHFVQCDNRGRSAKAEVGALLSSVRMEVGHTPDRSCKPAHHDGVGISDRYVVMTGCGNETHCVELHRSDLLVGG